MFQSIIRLQPRSRGFHLITAEILSSLPEIEDVQQGILHLFLQHTSASLTLNENADPTVRGDMERFFLDAVPDDFTLFEHTLEGADDMPAHVKASLLGASVTIPVRGGELQLGVWQGIWLGEHRVDGGSRSVVATSIGV